MLTYNLDLNNKKILDIGCGFGDINNWFIENKIINYSYYGIDIVKQFIDEANNRYGNDNIKFECEEFLNKNFDFKFDYIISSGIFNYKMTNIDNYEYINKVMKKAFDLCNEAICFDFLSDKVDFKAEGAFHSNPSIILDMAYSISSRLILNNSYMPFEFNIIIFKDTQVDQKNICYQMYKHIE